MAGYATQVGRLSHLTVLRGSHALPYSQRANSQAMMERLVFGNGSFADIRNQLDVYPAPLTTLPLVVWILLVIVSFLLGLAVMFLIARLCGLAPAKVPYSALGGGSGSRRHGATAAYEPVPPHDL